MGVEIDHLFRHPEHTRAPLGAEPYEQVTETLCIMRIPLLERTSEDPAEPAEARGGEAG